MKRFATLLVCLACCFALLFSFAGCGQKDNAANDAKANRAYMSQLNIAMDELNGKLGSFTEAVSEGDLITMRNLSKKVTAKIDEIRSFEAPAQLKSISEQYLQGLDNLDGALKAYIALYEDVEAGKDIDVKAEVEKIQKAYDAGISQLKDADTAASKL